MRQTRFAMHLSLVTWRLWLVLGCSVVAIICLLAVPWGIGVPSFGFKVLSTAGSPEFCFRICSIPAAIMVTVEVSKTGSLASSVAVL